MPVCRHCKVDKAEHLVAPLVPRYATRVCYDCKNAKCRHMHHTSPGHKQRVKNKKLQRLYGIDLATYDSMFVAQGGVCKICKKPPTESDHGCLNVDHCHETGKVRGLLCILCNTGLGKFGDNSALLREAVNYLEA